MKEFHSALDHICAVKGMDLSISKEISMLIGAVRILVCLGSCDFLLGTSPCCCRDSVPYKPIHLASDRDPTLKTCFLLSLTMAKCVGEFHCLG